MRSERVYRAHHRNLEVTILDAVLIDTDTISPNADNSALVSEVAKGAMQRIRDR